MCVGQAIFFSLADLPSYLFFLTFSYKQSETAVTYLNKQFRQRNQLLSFPISQEEINYVIFVWVYELKNNWHLFTNKQDFHYLLKITNWFSKLANYDYIKTPFFIKLLLILPIRILATKRDMLFVTNT